MDVASIAAWLGIAVTAGGALAGVVRFGFWVFDEWRKRKANAAFFVPKKTLQLTPMPEGHCWWAMGKRGDAPTMQVVGRAFVTNISPVTARIPHAELRFGFWGRRRVSGLPSVSRGARDNMHGMYDIPSGETRDLAFDFWIFPPVVAATSPFISHSISFADQFGNRHVLRRVRFRSMAADTRPAPRQPEEFPYEITDPVVKEIVAVLKAELGRYAICGRTVGGLGSVHIVHQGRVLTGMGTDSWTPDSPLNQVLSVDAVMVSVQSDNLEALLAFYGRLQSDDERSRFAAALLDRLAEDRGYLGVSYFIVATLWRMGRLPVALEKARASLPVGEQRVFGLSNVLLLLNGLLRYRHTDFSSSDLDDIERFIHGLDEHPMRIPDKIAAIRASRLALPPAG